MFVVYVTKIINTTKHYKLLVKYKMPIENKKQLVTSLRINPEVWKEAKVAAIQNDLTLTQLVEEAIHCWIQQQMQKREKK
jgi:hypothetical protein